MLLNKDGSFTRDIDIDELSVSFGGHCGKSITLNKDKITYQNTVHPTIAYMDFPKGYFDSKSISLSREEFLKISDDIHNAGLLSILSPNENMKLLDGAVYETMHCCFDDGACYHYSSRKSQVSDVFKRICDILSDYCVFNSLNNGISQDMQKRKSDESVTVAMPIRKIAPTIDDIESDKKEYDEMLKTIDELRCRMKERISFLKMFGEKSVDTVAVIQDVLSKIIEIENQLSDNRQIYDNLKNDYINYGSGKELEL